jgi:hypothetical protein
MWYWKDSGKNWVIVAPDTGMQSVFEGNRQRWIFEDGTAVLIERASPRELKTLAKGGVSRDSCA